MRRTKLVEVDIGDLRIETEIRWRLQRGWLVRTQQHLSCDNWVTRSPHFSIIRLDVSAECTYPFIHPSICQPITFPHLHLGHHASCAGHRIFTYRSSYLARETSLFFYSVEILGNPVAEKSFAISYYKCHTLSNYFENAPFRPCVLHEIGDP